MLSHNELATWSGFQTVPQLHFRTKNAPFHKNWKDVVKLASQQILTVHVRTHSYPLGPNTRDIPINVHVPSIIYPIPKPNQHITHILNISLQPHAWLRAYINCFYTHKSQFMVHVYIYGVQLSIFVFQQIIISSNTHSSYSYSPIWRTILKMTYTVHHVLQLIINNNTLLMHINCHFHGLSWKWQAPFSVPSKK